MSSWSTEAQQWAAWTQVEVAADPVEALDAFDSEVARRLDSAGFAANLEQTAVTAAPGTTLVPDPDATLVRPSPTAAAIDPVADEEFGPEAAKTIVRGQVDALGEVPSTEHLDVSLESPESGLEIGLEGAPLEHPPDAEDAEPDTDAEDAEDDTDADVDGLVLPSLTLGPEPEPEPAVSGHTVIAPAPTEPEPEPPEAVSSKITLVPTEVEPARTGDTLPPIADEQPRATKIPDEGQAMSSGVFRAFDLDDEEEPEPPMARQKVVIGSPQADPSISDEDTSEIHADDLVEDPQGPPPLDSLDTLDAADAVEDVEQDPASPGPPPPKDAPKPPPAPPVRGEATPPEPPEPPVTAPEVPLPAAPASKAPAPASTPKAPGWPEDVFAEHYVAMTRANHPKLAKAEAEFFVQSTGLPAGARVLDVGCGDGAHALALAQRGFEVTAVDISPSQLARAERAREALGAPTTFVRGDMRDLGAHPGLEGPFEGILCMGSSFGYYDDEENRAVLRTLAARLSPGGRLLLHVFNRDHIIGRLPTRSWWQGRGCLVLDEAQMNFFNNRLSIHRTVVFEDGRQFEHRYQIRGYNAHELGRLCVDAGLRIVEISGSRLTRGHFYGASSADIWLVLEPKPRAD